MTSDVDGVGQSVPGLPRLSRSEDAREDPQRKCQDCWARARMILGKDRTLARARRLMKQRVSSDHLPPTSAAKTTSLALPCVPESSGYVLSLRPSEVAHWRCGTPSAREEKPELCQWPAEPRGKRATPLTSSRRPPSTPPRGAKSRSRTKMLVETRAPASRQMRVATD